MSKDRFYQVEAIVGYKEVGGVPHYKVHWKGYNHRHDTWEPASNLTASLIDEYHSQTKEPSTQKTRLSTRRSLAAGKQSLETSSNKEPPSRQLRRSQRARTPTRRFASEDSATTTPQKQNPATKPSTKNKAPEKRRNLEEEEIATDSEDEEDGEVAVKRSKYELRSRNARRKSPRRVEPVHYFNSELPNSRKPQSTNGASKPILSSDEGEDEKEVEGGEVSSMTPQISLYESQVRKRLSNLSSLTRKKVAEALTTITGEKTQDTAKSAETEPALPPDPARQDEAMAPSTSSHVYETRSQGTRPQPSKPLQSSKPPPPTTRRTLRSTTTTTLPPPAKTVQDSTDSSPQLLSNTEPSDTEPSDTDSSASPSSPQEDKMPTWMKFGWEEAIFTLIVIGLLLFAYYCFKSEYC